MDGACRVEPILHDTLTIPQGGSGNQERGHENKTQRNTALDQDTANVDPDIANLDQGTANLDPVIANLDHHIVDLERDSANQGQGLIDINQDHEGARVDEDLLSIGPVGWEGDLQGQENFAQNFFGMVHALVSPTAPEEGGPGFCRISLTLHFLYCCDLRSNVVLRYLTCFLYFLYWSCRMTP